jgi:agmatine deiminase
MATSTPSRRLPGDWEQHRATVVAWPGRPSVWGPNLAQGRDETAHLIRSIARTEDVLIAVDPWHTDTLPADLRSHPRVLPLHLPLDDCWARDIAPMFVLDPQPIAVDFGFNAWGGKFSPYDNDNALGARLTHALEMNYEHADLVLEGGSITTDGAGTAIIVEPTVVNPNRNPGLSRSEVEEALRDTLGLTHVIWLPYGLLDDTDTDGHVDNVAVFVDPTTVLAQAPPSRHHPDAARLRANLAILEQARTADGRQLTVATVRPLPASRLDPARPSSYINIYPCTGQVLVPTVGDVKDDDEVGSLLTSLFPTRTISFTPADAIAYGGGGPHCMTMQIPTTKETAP